MLFRSEDGLAGQGRYVDDKMLAGLRLAKELGMAAPGIPAPSTDAGQEA